ncbi:hypothetical protein [Vibrio breoganii]|nr:hypothetical protein [Vibrio breoganii]MDN3715863.1 hypothetical protein [Vibrio breoganii]
MGNDLGALVIGQQSAIKMMEQKFDGKIERRKPSMFKKLMKKLTK